MNNPASVPRPEQNQRIRVGVLYGGQSSEHSVSCISAGAIMSHIDTSRYEIIPIGITRSGTWVPGTTDARSLEAQGSILPVVAESEDHIQIVIGYGSSKSSENGPKTGLLRYSSGPRVGQDYGVVDIIMPVLHGPYGEDGTIQGLLDLAGVAYVGNGVLASAAGMDKEYTKKIASAVGLPIGREHILYSSEEKESVTDEVKEYLGLPVFVKPARGGSSIGISKVDRWDEFSSAVDLAFKYDHKVIIESMIHGAEVECGVLQHPDGEISVSVPALLQGTEEGSEGFYGFEAKYLDEGVTASIPAPLASEQIEDIQRLAVATFRALGCEGLARVDFFVTDTGIVLNEINTFPGFTPISMYPAMFEATGIPYAELLSILIERGLKTH